MAEQQVRHNVAGLDGPVRIAIRNCLAIESKHVSLTRNNANLVINYRRRTGQVPAQQMEIDLVKLCSSVGARLIVDPVIGIDHQQRELKFADRPPIAFDVLAVGIGSQPSYGNVDGAIDRVLAIKPMQTFLGRLDEQLRAAAALRDGKPLQIVVVGAGAGGVEITMCLPSRLARVVPEAPFELTVVQADSSIIPNSIPSTAKRVRRVFVERGVRLCLSQRVVSIGDDSVTLDSGELLPADLIIWATSATADPLLASFDLPLDSHGFLLTDADRIDGKGVAK